MKKNIISLLFIGLLSATLTGCTKDDFEPSFKIEGLTADIIITYRRRLAVIVLPLLRRQHRKHQARIWMSLIISLDLFYTYYPAIHTYLTNRQPQATGTEATAHKPLPARQAEPACYFFPSNRC